MLELRPVCEHCAKELPNGSAEAMICSFECTFCVTCVDELLHNVCPNCGGGFQLRPTRPAASLLTHPPTTQKKIVPINFARFAALRDNMEGINPFER